MDKVKPYYVYIIKPHTETKNKSSRQCTGKYD